MMWSKSWNTKYKLQKHYKYLTYNTLILHQNHYIWPIIKLQSFLNTRNSSPGLKEWISEYHLNAALKWKFSLMKLVGLHDNLLNILMPEWYIFFWKHESMSTWLWSWYLFLVTLCQLFCMGIKNGCFPSIPHEWSFFWEKNPSKNILPIQAHHGSRTECRSAQTT